MDYYICNNGVYIKLDINGTPTTCVKQLADRFEWSKAQNLLKCLPRHLRKFHFKLQAIPDIPPPKNKVDSSATKAKQVMINKNYEIPDTIQNWAQKAKECNGLAIDAKRRKDELVEELVKISNEEKLLWHRIQFTRPLNACNGYKVYREIKDLLDRRRDAKDELLIVDTILTMDISSLATDRIQRCVDGLKTRVYSVPNVGTEKVGE